MIRIKFISIFILFYASVVQAQSCIELVQPTALTVVCSKVDVSVYGANNGEATVAVNGGTSPYQYLWSSGATSSTLTNLSAGTYEVTVTDVNGCSMTCSSVVNEPVCVPPSAGADITLACNGNQHLSSTQLVAAPTGYSWHLSTQPNGSTATINNSGLVQGMTQLGDYVFELRQDNYSSCKDSIRITAPTCVLPCPTNNCGSISVRKL